ncbi:MAG: hypothetical protein NC935_05235, partial [Candidatus Omnitrophica bacterium]|nr:hypothetical protein [Candidatus Omnitrophota bacterium]
MKIGFRRIFVLFIFALLVSGQSFASKITIVYTGNSFSNLYPCGVCPASVGGGVARRATVIKSFKKTTQNLFLIEGGNFMGGDYFNEVERGFNLDKKRTKVYLRALDAMGYEILGIGGAEFNFGIDFLKENLKNTKAKFLSSNLFIDGILPYYIKEFFDPIKNKNIRVAVFGLTPKNILKKVSVEEIDYEVSLQNVLNNLKEKVDFFILLAPLPQEDIQKIIKKFPEFKIILSGKDQAVASYEKIGETYVINPAYQAKQLAIIELELDDGKILDFQFKTKSLSLDIKEDVEILKIIPSCFSDADCIDREGLIKKCNFLGELNSVCAYYDANKIDVILITDTSCTFCSVSKTVNFLKKIFLGINFKVLKYKQKEASQLIKKYNLETLPLFIFPAYIENDKNFPQIEKFVEKKGDIYVARPPLSGIFLFLNRNEIPSRIDLFIDLYDRSALGILTDLIKFSKNKNLDFNLHFTAPTNEKIKKFYEEIKIAFAIKKKYPDKFYLYIIERLKNIESLYWIEVLENLKIDYKKIRSSVVSGELNGLVDKELEFSKQLNINTGNAILINNRRLFRILKVDENV